VTETARILVVDDEEIIRRMLVTWLLRWGHDVIEAESAPAALALMEENPAEILIVDLIMPVYTGFWLIERVHQRWPSTCIIVESGAHEDEVNFQNARGLGAMAFLPKPFGRELIHQTLTRFIHRCRAPHSVGSHDSQAQHD
jgi:two-component system KDP operon response regulator KdpE